MLFHSFLDLKTFKNAILFLKNMSSDRSVTWNWFRDNSGSSVTNPIFYKNVFSLIMLCFSTSYAFYYYTVHAKIVTRREDYDEWCRRKKINPGIWNYP